MDIAAADWHMIFLFTFFLKNNQLAFLDNWWGRSPDWIFLHQFLSAFAHFSYKFPRWVSFCSNGVSFCPEYHSQPLFHPFRGFVWTKNTPNPTPKHPFSWPELKSGRNELLSGQPGPQLGNMFKKQTRLFWKWPKILNSSWTLNTCTDQRARGSLHLSCPPVSCHQNLFCLISHIYPFWTGFDQLQKVLCSA